MIKTSESHPLRIDSLEIPGIEGVLGLTFCPGKKQTNAMTGIWDRDLYADIQVIKGWGASTVISLLEPHELDELSVENLPELLKQNGLKWFLFEIPDTQPPGDDFEADWNHVKQGFYEELNNGEKIIFHCKGGLGRTGTIAARILVEYGAEPEDAIKLVRRARRGTIENSLQEEYILRKKWE